MVFDFPYIEDKARLNRSLRYTFGGAVIDDNDRTIISFRHPSIYHSLLLSALEDEKLIQVTMKEYSFEKGSFPLYVNATGWRVPHNIFSYLLTILVGLAKKKRKKEQE